MERLRRLLENRSRRWWLSSESLEERGPSPPLRLLPRRWEKPFLGEVTAAPFLGEVTAPPAAEKRESLKLRFIMNQRNQ